MVIVLFLVAVAISLFFGRLAEVLTRRLNARAGARERSEGLPAPEPLPAPPVEANTDKAA